MERTIGQHMTPCPHSIGSQQPLGRAIDFMRSHRVRHLPVLNGGELVGMLSDRDIALLDGLGEALSDELTAGEVMSSEPYSVPPQEPLAAVLRTMADRRLGAAVVVNAGRVVGIYTSTDAVRTLAQTTAQEQTHTDSASLGHALTTHDTGDFEAVLASTRNKLTAAGFHILAELNLKRVLYSELGMDFRPYTQLSAHIPQLTHTLVQTEPLLGLQLQCTVLLDQFEPGTVHISASFPAAAQDWSERPHLQKVIAEVESRLRRTLFP